MTFSIKTPKKGAVAGVKVQWLRMVIFREREDSFSLGFRPIRPSVFNGAISKAILRGEGYAWAPICWSSDNSKR